MQAKRIALVAIVALVFVQFVRAEPQIQSAVAPATQPSAVVNAAIDRVAGLLRVPESGAAKVFSASVRVTRLPCPTSMSSPYQSRKIRTALNHL